MTGAILAALALGMTAIAFWQKKHLLFLMTGFTWIIFGGVYLDGAVWPSIDSAAGLLGITFGFVFILYVAVIIRRKPEPPQFLEEDEAYSQQLDRETGRKKDD